MNRRGPTSPSAAILHRLRIIVPVFILVIGIGTGGYRLLEDEFSWLDSVYQSVITISTVGFNEVRPLGDDSRIFTVLLILLGVSAFTYTFGSLGELFVAGEFRGLVRARRMRKTIADLSEHYIICGFGRTGERIAGELSSVGKSVVIIESDPVRLELARENHWLAIEGDAGTDEILADAKIEAASRLVAATGSDATNVMISLSARTLNPDIFIVSRADDEANEQKLLKAGANRVVPIYRSTGRRMAQLAIRPHAVETTDIVLGDQEIELSIEDVSVQPGAQLDGATLEECTTPEGGNYMIIAVRRHDGELEMTPPPSTRISAHDVLVVFGTRDQLQQLEQLTTVPA